MTQQIPIPFCTGCNKRGDEIYEYIDAANEFEEGMDVNCYIREEEGTYNRETGHFLCTDCYVKQGMPSSPSGWVAS